MPTPNTGTPPSCYVHPTSLVETSDLGSGALIWAFVHILNDVHVGQNTTVCDHCFVENGVYIGDNVTLKCGIYIWKGTTIENDVFLGPNVVFTNDVRPRSKNADFTLSPTLICQGASIGANSTVLAGVTVGRYALSGIGAVITRDVKDYALVYGNPARQHGWVDEVGQKLVSTDKVGVWKSPATGQFYQETVTGLTPLVV